MLEMYRFDELKTSKMPTSTFIGTSGHDKQNWYFRGHRYFRGIDCDYPERVEPN